MAGDMFDQSEAAGFEQGVPHGGVERGDAQGIPEQVAVHVGESGQVLIQRLLAVALRGVQHLEEFRQPGAGVRAVLARALLDVVQKGVARLEDARVVREEAEDDAHQEAFEIVPPVARLGEGVVQVPREFGGLDVGGVLIAKGAAAHPQDEGELLDVGGKIGEGEGGVSPLVQIVEFEGLEIAHEDVAGPVAFGQGVEVFPRLPVGGAPGRGPRSSARR